MEIPTVLVIVLCIMFLGVIYVVIETAVRRGIDSSETSQMIKKLLEKQNKSKN